MADAKKLLGQRIKAIRKQKHMTQEQLAERVGVDARHISRVETGAHYPSMETLEQIAEGLERPMADLLATPKDKDSEEAMRFFLIDLGRTLELEELRRVVRVVRATIEKA
jgi:transcriptional regulator with XRE-family HTH domain